MVRFSELPASVIGHILGREDISFIVIKFWLCGDKNLNKKLSNGLTFLELGLHPFAACSIPQMVAHLQSLRHLAIYFRPGNGVAKLLQLVALLRVLPSSLEHLALSVLPWNIDPNGVRITTNYPRGASRAIELDTLFPQLHTLTITADVFPELFPALPSSLTELICPISLNYCADGDTSYLAKLPPHIRSLTGPVEWVAYNPYLDRSAIPESDDKAINALIRDFSNAPSGLQTITLSESWLFWPTVKDCWLPKSLTELKWDVENSPTWSPSNARTLPPELLSLALGKVDTDAYRGIDWIADLPRSLTKLSVSPESMDVIDFASYGQSLPRGMTELTLTSMNFFSNEAFGDWSMVSGADYWLSKLTTLNLHNFWFEPTELKFLPRTINTLSISVSTSTQVDQLKDRPKLETKLLPPNITSLDLQWTPTVIPDFLPLRNLPLKDLSLLCTDRDQLDVPWSELTFVPDSVAKLTLSNHFLDHPANIESMPLLPNLTYLEARGASCGGLQCVPRQIQHIILDYVSGLKISSLVPKGDLFKGLPASLRTLSIRRYPADGVGSLLVLPPQKLEHLSSLTTLQLNCAPTVSSKILRHLPSSLLNLNIDLGGHPNKDDLPFIPPLLRTCNLGRLTLQIAQRLPLAALLPICQSEILNGPNQTLPVEIRSLLVKRVQEAASNQ